jgi:predicted ATPase/DNA-binding SARP family transcriptional activator
MDARWRINLLGELHAEGCSRVIHRFRTQKTGTLLAYLAYHLQRSHPREELIELLWPGCDAEHGRNSLSKALSSLRQQLEPPGVPRGDVIIADHASLRLNPGTVETDVAEFQAANKAAARVGSGTEQARLLTRAAELYRGPFLSGRYDDWILAERGWLAERFFQALRRLLARLEEAADWDRALEYARRGIGADPLREEAHADLIRLFALAGQPAAALRQFQELERLLRHELGASPSRATRALARRIERLAAEGQRTLTLPRLPYTSRSRRGPARALRQKTGPRSSQAFVPTRGHLPLQLTRFFGRETELSRLAELLSAAETRLVTLTGPGGSGKTRLALEVAGRLAEAWHGAVWFASLVDVADPRRVPDTLRDVLRLPGSPDVEPLEQIVAVLSRQPTLLLLDNFEHLVDEGVPRVQTLLERVPTLTCLVTSRRRLDLAGEREFPVVPLPIPGPEDPPERLAHCRSVQLFVDRAQAVRPDFRVTARNAAAVAALCRGLEGIPLALELAAARAQVLTPAQMAADLSHRFDLLASRQRNVAERHRTLRAALDWSYQLLSPELQRTFARLSVFRAGWTIEAAVAVCEEPEALEQLQELCACSLVLAEESGPEMRFRMLEMLRDYGGEQLTPEERSALERRHAEYFAAMAERAEPELKGPDQGTWLERLEAEHDNLRAGLSRSAEGRLHELGLRLAAALWLFWDRRGHWREGREWLEGALAAARDGGSAGHERSATRAKALYAAGMMACLQGEGTTAGSLLDESAAIWRELREKRGLADALLGLGNLADADGDATRARSLWEKSTELFRQEGDNWGLANSLGCFADAALVSGDNVTARSLWEESLSLLRAQGDTWGMTFPLDRLGEMARRQGELGAAEARFQESLEIRRALGDKPGIARSLGYLGYIADNRGDYVVSRGRYEESLVIWRDLASKRDVAATLDFLGQMTRNQGDYEAARAFCDESLTIRRELGDRRGLAGGLGLSGDIAYYQGDTTAGQALLEESLALYRELDDKRGIAWCLQKLGNIARSQQEQQRAVTRYRESLTVFGETENPGGIAAVLEGLARAASAWGQPKRAASLFGAAETLRDALGSPLQPAERVDHDRCVTAARAALSEEEFAAAWAAGQAMTLEQAVVSALEE